MPAKLDLTGQVFGELTVLREAGRAGHKEVTWLCRCSCGKATTVAARDLRKGDTRSCGHLHGQGHVQHGHARRGRTPEYVAWRGAITRCHDPNTRNFADYGGRGIAVCDRWRQSFAAFLEDVGPRPGPGYLLDRRDNASNYEPGNVRWVTRRVSNINQRLRKDNKSDSVECAGTTNPTSGMQRFPATTSAPTLTPSLLPSPTTTTPSSTTAAKPTSTSPFPSSFPPPSTSSLARSDFLGEAAAASRGGGRMTPHAENLPFAPRGPLPAFRPLPMWASPPHPSMPWCKPAPCRRRGVDFRRVGWCGNASSLTTPSRRCLMTEKNLPPQRTPGATTRDALEVEIRR